MELYAISRLIAMGPVLENPQVQLFAMPREVRTLFEALVTMITTVRTFYCRDGVAVD